MGVIIMRYKQLWQKLKIYIEQETCFPEYLSQKEHCLRHIILKKMEFLENLQKNNTHTHSK